MNRLSEDQETLLAISTWRPSNSVTLRNSPPEDGIAQMLFPEPSAKSTTTHLPSGDNSGWIVQAAAGIRSPGIRARTRDGPVSGSATRISKSGLFTLA